MSEARCDRPVCFQNTLGKGDEMKRALRTALFAPTTDISATWTSHRLLMPIH